MSSKLLPMRAAIAKYVHDGMTIAVEGFTSGIAFAAAHEIIRQQRRGLTLCRLTPDLVYDQMIAAGCARKLVFSYLGNPGVGSLHAIRRAVEHGVPHALELEEYSHFGMLGRYSAGAACLPFFPLRSYSGSDLPKVNARIQFIADPYGSGEIAVVPPLNPDVTIIHAQRADENGNTQTWGLSGTQKEAALAAQNVIVVVEELVPEEVIRADPNRTLLPALAVNAVVHEPFGAHPSFVQGFYDRDNEFYIKWDEISRSASTTDAWIKEWVLDVPDWPAYVQKLGAATRARLAPGSAFSQPVNYGLHSA